ncbi:MAG: 2-oxoacid:acceptor oxidoreductase subunit alpha [Chitinispirillia bacterium]|jgi:2-oxoglutarate ferredoxin oxidoreductase subunit alpha
MGREFLEGNEAIARAAIKAKCDFFAGYPITPSSSILHYMLKWIPDNGGLAIQAEDEIASIGFCIGAAMTGRKVLTATSGPGLSLYSENIGLAIIGETPLVIVNIQRQGPATGSATKGAEGDILFTRWVTSGGLPIIALSPATVTEAYELTFKAFNFAEKYRSPVFVLSNKEIGVMKESVDLGKVNLPETIERKKYNGDKNFQPYFFSKPEDIPQFANIGEEYITRFTTSTHDKKAYLTTDPLLIQDMIDHYIAKIEGAADDIILVKEDFEEGAKVLIISYGITSRSAAAAVKIARKNNIKISSLVIQTLFPLPEKAINSAMNGIEKVIIPEMNMGQYRLEIERLINRKINIIGVNKMDTTLISPQQILKKGEIL